ncbi:MAG: hypothetical protein JNM65_00300 [Verrucomicrobiaceae bacterium]|nr:hypothetical protein [Verrucomicrobiaceae bacterium]
MNWGRLNELVIRNWREKIISIVLAFLFWFMVKAQDARRPSYLPPQPVRVSPQTLPAAPPQLSPTLEPTPEAPEKFTPVLPAPLKPAAPPPAQNESIRKSTGL